MNPYDEYAFETWDDILRPGSADTVRNSVLRKPKKRTMSRKKLQRMINRLHPNPEQMAERLRKLQAANKTAARRKRKRRPRQLSPQRLEALARPFRRHSDERYSKDSDRENCTFRPTVSQRTEEDSSMGRSLPLQDRLNKYHREYVHRRNLLREGKLQQTLVESECPFRPELSEVSQQLMASQRKGFFTRLVEDIEQRKHRRAALQAEATREFTHRPHTARLNHTRTWDGVEEAKGAPPREADPVTLSKRMLALPFLQRYTVDLEKRLAHKRKTEETREQLELKDCTFRPKVTVKARGRGVSRFEQFLHRMNKDVSRRQKKEFYRQLLFTLDKDQLMYIAERLSSDVPDDRENANAASTEGQDEQKSQAGDSGAQ